MSSNSYRKILIVTVSTVAVLGLASVNKTYAADTGASCENSNNFKEWKHTGGAGSGGQGSDETSVSSSTEEFNADQWNEKAREVAEKQVKALDEQVQKTKVDPKTKDPKKGFDDWLKSCIDRLKNLLKLGWGFGLQVPDIEGLLNQLCQEAVSKAEDKVGQVQVNVDKIPNENPVPNGIPTTTKDTRGNWGYNTNNKIETPSLKGLFQ